MITLKDIDKYYDSKFQRTYVLKGIDLEVETGDFLTVMGPSGSGKSTLLNIIGLLNEPSQGEYLLHGGPVHQLTAKKKTEYNKGLTRDA